MNEPYEETLEGQLYLRRPPGERHELICGRLHERMTAALAQLTAARLLPLRSAVEIAHDTSVRPDLALVTAATNKLWLAAEIVSSGDHSPDTVTKKAIYENHQVPRLWMVDPRYDNVEVYHGGPHGLALREILALREVLTEPLVPEFQYAIADLFKG